MVHDLRIAGAVYKNVPSIVLSDPNNHWIQYFDISDATVTAKDIAAGKTAYNANGEKITGTATGGAGGGDSDEAEKIKKWLYADETYVGYLTVYPDFILNATSLRQYACAGFYPINCTNPTFPSLKSVPSDLFEGNFYLKGFTGPAVTKLETGAFSGLGGLETVNIPNVETVDNNAFATCYGLKEVNFPLCKTIGMSAFQSCSALAKADIGACEKIGMYVFDGCDALKTLILRGDKVCTMDDANALGYSSWSKDSPLAEMNGAIYVPDSLVDAYKKATNWSIFASIIKPLSTYAG